MFLSVVFSLLSLLHFDQVTVIFVFARYQNSIVWQEGKCKFFSSADNEIFSLPLQRVNGDFVRLSIQSLVFAADALQAGTELNASPTTQQTHIHHLMART